ncbi:hypothetical protein [Devosia submarina]|uniref:hypothetical protein n=1 Tax=Devosia submarina TaxID=1173082 RepID=UPI000D3D70C7|nr:hypothetical protein [Devosia submarina]
MLSSKFLKDIMTEAYPIIKRQLEDAQVIASFRDLVSANGGDWSALKALMKAHVEDSLDEGGDGKRVKKILDKADSSNAYAEMLGLANMNEKNYFAEDAQETRLDPIAALRADPAMAIVEPSKLKTKSEPQPTKAAVQMQASADGPQAAEGVVIPASLAGAEGIVDRQPIQPETANDCQQPPETDQRLSVAGPRDTAGRQSADTLRAGRGRPGDGVTAGETAPVPSPGKSVEAPASTAPRQLYAAPGVITWEHAPPEGVRRHDYSQAFGDLGQDAAVIEDDLANAAAEPIVKIGPVILDGWARYIKSRTMVSLDGKPVEYSVVQYDGTDPLMDCIRWNLAGRILNDAQKRTIAQRLARLEPSRKEEIYSAFELGMELVV